MVLLWSAPPVLAPCRPWIPQEHRTTSQRLPAPTLIRCEVLEALYRAVRRGDLQEDEGGARLTQFARMKIRYLGDQVSRGRAWDGAGQLGWESTRASEYIALTQLQADAFVTLDRRLALEVAGLIPTAPLDVLL
jgi:predicted nucleic acid-binding protein